ncbi:MAG: endonuclease/exonuclease/phosphatase family protein [Bacteroidota bacterium]
MRKLNNLLLLASIALLAGCAAQGNDSEKANEATSEVYEPAGIVKPVNFEYENKEKFKVISWNVEHFLDEHDNPYINNGREDEPAERMGDKPAMLVKALKEVNADIIVLQEFESASYLRALAQDSLLKDLGYRYFADAPSHTWYMNVVVMSKVPLGVLYAYGNVTTPLPNYTNDEGKAESQNRINTRMWSIDVYPDEDYSFVLTGLHLKAGRGPRNIAMRTGQINFLRGQFDRFLRENPNKNILVVGDLNCTPDSEEYKVLLGDAASNVQFTDPLDTAILTHPADEPRRRLDHMLANNNMAKEIVAESVHVPYIFSKEEMRTLSDHLPVVGEFYLDDKN